VELDGDNLRNLPIETRNATLASLLRKSVTLQLSEGISADGPQVFAHACKPGAEGIVSKRLGSPDRSGPHAAWVKVRNPASIAVQRERSENWNK
jgi:bifunctional non-homologous end joining protein LigD